MLSVNGHLYERIVASVLEDVRAGRLRPGDRVASEHELAAQFEVSRITSRRALEELTRLSVVERSQGRGTFVARELPNLEALGASPGLVSIRAEASREHGVQHGVIGLVLPDFSDPYGLHLVYAIEEAVSDVGLHLILKRTYGQRTLEEDAIARLIGRGLDGLIVFPVHGEHYNPVLLKAVLDGFPVVLVDRYLRGIPAHAVVTDNRTASAALTEHLIGLGHREIAFVSPPVVNTSALEERLEGFNAALARHGLPQRPEHLLANLLSTLPTQFRPENIAADQDTLQQFVKGLSVTAFVCTEYNLALELTQTLEAMGHCVPEDFSIACFDSPEVPLERPRFTHVRQGEAAMGRTAVELILDRLNGKTPPMRTHVDFEIVAGRSTASPTRNSASRDNAKRAPKRARSERQEHSSQPKKTSRRGRH